MPKPERVITHAGRTQTLREWAAEFGMSSGNLATRIRRLGQARAMNGKPDHGVGQARSGVILDEVAVELGVCRERCRQIESEALQKLRVAHAMIDALGLETAWPVIASLRGQTVARWRRAWRVLVNEAFRRVA